MDWKTLFFSAEGRIGRSTFWMGWLVLLGVNVVIGWIPFVGLLSLVTIYCGICLKAKRLHDMGRSGYLQVFPLIAVPALVISAIISVAGPAIMAGIADANESQVMAAVFAGLGGMLLFFLAAFVIGFGFLLWVGLTDSQPGENRYGAPPATSATA